MFKKNYGGDKENVPFNSSIQFLERLERRFEDANESKIDGQLITYYRSTQTIMHTMIPFMSQDERTRIKVFDDLASQEVKNVIKTSIDPGFLYEDAERSIDNLYIELIKFGVEKKLIYYQYEKLVWDEELEADYS